MVNMSKVNSWASSVNTKVKQSVSDGQGGYSIKKLMPWIILIFVVVIGKNLLGIVKSFFEKVEEKVVGPEITDVHGSGSVGSPTGQLSVDPQKLSYSLDQFKIFADQLEQAIYDTYLTEDDAKIFTILSQMKTTGDIYALINAYGTRNGGSWYNTAYNLPMAVQTYLDNFYPYDYKNQLNQMYKSKNIAYVFA